MMGEHNPLFHKVKIEPIDGSLDRVSVCVDDLPIRCSKVDIHMEVGAIHQTDIRLLGEPELEYTSLVTFDFDPRTVRRAVDVLKIALERNDFIAELGMNDLNKILESRNG